MLQLFPVTSALVGLNLAVFAVMVMRGLSPIEPTVDQLRQWGANFGPLSLGGQPWRMLVSNYLHGGLLHIGFNMWCLWNLGRLAERVFDRWTYFLAYTACGLAGSISSLWWHPLVTGVGASGAIFGLAGTLIAVLYLGRFQTPREALRPTLRSLLTFAGYNLFFGAIATGIDNSAHVGGLVCGLVVGAVLARVPAGSRESRLRWWRSIFAAVGVLLAASFLVVRHANGYVVPLTSGQDALRKGQVDKAIPDLEAARARKPGDQMTLLLLANAYSQKHDYERAQSMVETILKSDPGNQPARYYLGSVYLDTGRFEAARQIFAKLAEENPRHAGVLIFLGQSQAGLGRQDEALQSFARAVQADPSSPDARRYLGLQQLRAGKTADAIATLEEGVRRSPADPDLQRALGFAYRVAGREADAVTAFQKAADLEKQQQ